MNADTTVRREFEAALSRIQLHAMVSFRHVACAHRKADCIAETVGLAWTWWVRLSKQGKDPTQFVSAIARYAARAVSSGRRVCGQERTQDVLSPLAQRRHGFGIQHLPDFGTLSENPLSEALSDNTQTPPPEQAAFRIDFPRWVGSYDDRRKRILGQMMLGERTQGIARDFGLTAGRVSQLRQQFRREWRIFCGELG